MTQTAFSDGPPVPLMVEGLLDVPMLTRMFEDLAASSAVLGVREKGAPTEFTQGEMPLAAARDRLLSRATRAVQVRYHYDGQEWTDTILAVPEGFRVVRCRHE